MVQYVSQTASCVVGGERKRNCFEEYQTEQKYNEQLSNDLWKMKLRTAT